jgi:hypothetical protein
VSKPDLRRPTRNAAPAPRTQYEAATCRNCQADIMRRTGQQWIHVVTGRVACVREDEIDPDGAAGPS